MMQREKLFILQHHNEILRWGEILPAEKNRRSIKIFDKKWEENSLYPGLTPFLFLICHFT